MCCEPCASAVWRASAVATHKRRGTSLPSSGPIPPTAPAAGHIDWHLAAGLALVFAYV